MRHFEREALIWSSSLDAESKLILLALNQYLGSNETAWPSIDLLARDTSLNKRTILRRQQALVGIEVISVAPRYSHGMRISSQYKINWQALGVISVTQNPRTAELSKISSDCESPPENQDFESKPNKISSDSQSPPENQQCLTVTQAVTHSHHAVTHSHHAVTHSHSSSDSQSHRTNPIELIQRTNPIEKEINTARAREASISISKLESNQISDQQALELPIEQEAIAVASEIVEPRDFSQPQEPEQLPLLPSEPPEKTKGSGKSSGKIKKVPVVEVRAAEFVETYNRCKPPLWPTISGMSSPDRAKWLEEFHQQYRDEGIGAALEVILKGAGADPWASIKPMKVSFLFHKSRYADFYDVGQTLIQGGEDYERAVRLAQSNLGQQEIKRQQESDAFDLYQQRKREQIANGTWTGF